MKEYYLDNASTTPLDENASKVILKRFTTGTYGSCYKQEYLEKYGESQTSIVFKDGSTPLKTTIFK